MSLPALQDKSNELTRYEVTAFKRTGAIIPGVSVLLKQEKPLRKAVEVLYFVRVLRDRINRVYSRIEERKSELTKRMVDLENMGERYLAKRYAEEIARLNELLKRLSAIQLVLEKVDLAIQHAVIMRDLAGLSVELNKLLKDLSRLPETRIPDIGIMFAELENSVRELAELTSSRSFETSYNTPSSSDVAKILDEARELLRKNLEVS